MRYLNKHIHFKRILVMLMTAVLLFVGMYGFGTGVRADDEAYIKSGTTMLRVRESAGGNILMDESGNPVYLSGDTRVTVIDSTNSAWYKITFSYNGSQLEGYVSSSYVVMGSPEQESEVPTETPNDTAGEDQTSEEGDSEQPTETEAEDMPIDDFEGYMNQQGFPESYKPFLREMHKSHPSWNFIAIQTGIDWDTLVEKERNKSGQIKNLVYCTRSNPHYNWRSTEVGYNSSTNTWYPYDGTVWFAASNQLVKYYLDPRTYLYEAYIFSFESLSYQEGMQNQTGVEAILKGSFMSNSRAYGESRLYSDIIMDAAAKSNVSPYHLASRMKQEMGNTAGVAASGKSSSYPGIYNYFNIGAFDSPSGAAVLNGLKWAATWNGSYGRPWNTPSKSIIGGAQYLSQSYIAKGQDTLYTQKFNVTNKASLFNHQYMTNLQAPSTEGYSQYKAYAANGLLDSSIVFKIPVYLNMPSNPIAKPSDAGTSNDYLNLLSIDGYPLTPSFKSDILEYSLIVDGSVNQIRVNASPAASSSSVNGTGTINLAEGSNKIKISVTSDTGSVRNYMLTVVRGETQGGKSTEASQEVITFTPADQPSGSVKRGDLNGDGKISALDIIRVQRLIVGLDPTLEEIIPVADINRDGKISALDIIKIQRHIVGLETID